VGDNVGDRIDEIEVNRARSPPWGCQPFTFPAYCRLGAL
jgi:hypothetical protein